MKSSKREQIRDQAEVVKSVHRLREENAVLRAQIHASTGKLHPARALDGQDILADEATLIAENQKLREQFAAATVVKQTTATTQGPTACACPTGRTRSNFETASLDELCRAVRSGEIAESAASKILDARTIKPTPLTAQCNATKTNR